MIRALLVHCAAGLAAGWDWGAVGLPGATKTAPIRRGLGLVVALSDACAWATPAAKPPSWLAKTCALSRAMRASCKHESSICLLNDSLLGGWRGG